MIFNSVTYAVFLAIVLLVYWRLPRRPQNLLLVLASWVFYGWWDPRFLVLIWASTLLDWTVGRRLRATTDHRRRRVLVTASLVGNLGILGFFKYAGFFVESAVAAAAELGITLDAPTISIILPVGISFYTFQTLSYTIDVYRGEMEPTDSLLDFAAYVAFFPQLVAGPIERAQRLLPQFASERPRLDRDRVGSALELIAIGLFQKVVIADTMAGWVDDTVGGLENAGGARLAGAAVAFAIQIYGDFAGYSSIARGSARLLGFELMRNFEQPYLSTSITEFWRRWHVSLSTWLRDYLYIPLGGNRRGPRRTLINLMLTMLLGGLWHGAAWTFVLWGALHGTWLAAERVLRRGAVRSTPLPSPARLPLAVTTFALVTLAWIPFRSESASQAWDWFAGIVTWRDGSMTLMGLEVVVVMAVAALVLDVMMARAGTHAPLRRLTAVPAGAALGVLAVMAVVFTGQQAVPFLYFQF